ncbi:MAG: alanine racemase [Gracilimonas sp.]|uniref:alanine racemase n=1 Tax=Gracilimonas sp. TaxID=1974203 RepID=UPI0019915B7B|nr:alanine racemase [Gracilimonas sp.]MBD3615928.1 alanine racemase [Gracilimonas sp.]
MSSSLYVNLSKIGNNLKTVSSVIGPEVQKMAVVKDEAYGHGLIEVAKYLKDKVEWFCTARLSEAIALRKEGIKNPILVFELPPRGKESLYKAYNITASISDLSVFERLEPGTEAHLHFDTGMFRLGILPEDSAEVLQKMKQYDLNYSGIYTHFANSDEQNHPRVIKQLNIFRDIRAQFPDTLMTHTANSGAIFYYHEHGVLFDAVRPGVCLYGYAPGSVEIPELEPALEWKSELVQVKKIKKGELVGYGSRWEAPDDGWLGVVPVGYADGVFRNLSGCFKVEIAGELFQQVGTISMDFFTVYLGSKKLANDEPVTILKREELSPKVWAKKMGTIPYEITTAISPKVKRVYV